MIVTLHFTETVKYAVAVRLDKATIEKALAAFDMNDGSSERDRQWAIENYLRGDDRWFGLIEDQQLGWVNGVPAAPELPVTVEVEDRALDDITPEGEK